MLDLGSLRSGWAPFLLSDALFYPTGPDVVLSIRSKVKCIVEGQRLPPPVALILVLVYDPFSLSIDLASEPFARRRLEDGQVKLGSLCRLVNNGSFCRAIRLLRLA